MTGFGDASEQVDGVHYTAELRSLNNRYFKATIRLPESLASLEAELEMQLRRHVTRGSVTLTISMRDAGAGVAQKINEPALISYLEHLEAVHQKIAEKGRTVNIDLTALLALPGVLEGPDQSELVRRARPVVLTLLDRAAEKMTAMRITEGRALAADLGKQVEVIRTRLEQVAQRAPLVVEEYHQRLRTRIEELIRRAELAVDQKDLIREVAIFADRSDISEECTRLSGHLDQFQAVMDGPDTEPSGRTLDFIGQEMLREANTIASKSSDALISRAVVEIKSAIDRIKEQSQNAE